jgi:hypothetical protein
MLVGLLLPAVQRVREAAAKLLAHVGQFGTSCEASPNACTGPVLASSNPVWLIGCAFAEPLTEGELKAIQ